MFAPRCAPSVLRTAYRCFTTKTTPPESGKGRTYNDFVAEELHKAEQLKQDGKMSDAEYEASIHKAPAKVLQKFWDECLTVSGGGATSPSAGGAEKPAMSKVPPKGFDPRMHGPWNPAGAKTVNVSTKRPADWQYSG
eukprot:GGOE01064876.1.p2 GENE.GGOE01064876.1~~GGOE01064876.1.p2  ORF type:complete len:150 (+),score=37.77 GGOE01064876.1:40-450(+)